MSTSIQNIASSISSIEATLPFELLLIGVSPPEVLTSAPRVAAFRLKGSEWICSFSATTSKPGKTCACQKTGCNVRPSYDSFLFISESERRAAAG